MRSPSPDRQSSPTDSDLHQLANDFKAVWGQAATPSIEEFVLRVDEASRPQLLELLIAVELACRREKGEHPSRAEYEGRFGGFLLPESLFERTVAHFESAEATRQRQKSPDIPSRIGRYQIRRLLGRGGFGLVYLGLDGQLHREVAIKVPHAERVATSEDADLYLLEARTVANLDHRHIVPVYDVGGTKEYPVYIVSKYIEGTDLSSLMRSGRLSTGQIAELVATVADAMHYAHKQGLTHRDIKPGNILVDLEGRPHLLDFGLALREENVGRGPKYVGTPAYMSPEQARGEGHRVDGRSDIYSLGAVLYELLTGRRAFRGETKSELLDQVASKDPKPPRQIDDSIPKELERICLKSLSKRASERYTTALDLADDLRAFLVTLSSASGVTPTVGSPSSRSEGGRGSSVTVSSSSDPVDWGDRIKVIPKGLRAFDEHDADFFLELLPGPRDREGLPDSLRFWKHRVTERDADKTFSVGLIYGPSGCGKSSLVQAGLLPRLPSEVVCVYVESTPGETERRLLQRLRKRCPRLDRSQDLPNSLASLRRGEVLAAGEKVLIVIDQFEQWLHTRAAGAPSELVPALRQCDGGKLQCLLLVRDDFWMAITRFLSDLEVELSQGYNCRAMDLFPIRHARKVLAAFGRAYGALPETELSEDQQEFLKQSVSSLAEEEKVTCVRLALLAEMIKEKSWSPSMLKHLGGLTGVGVTFLEETFNSSSANPKHRYHEKAARAVLSALLPESGSGIRGQMKSYADLLEHSGYASRGSDFSDLIKLLDSEIRLITPTDPAGRDDPDSPAGCASYYQLTHDYLVPSLREWLTRQQRHSRRGRAELRLRERAAIWQAKPENRHLPAWWEYCSIRLLTRRSNWTAAQKKMMAKANKVQALHWGAALAIALMIGFASWRMATARRQLQVETLVASLRIDGSAIQPPLNQLEKYPRDMVLTELQRQFASGESSRIVIAYALSHLNDVPIDFLIQHVEDAEAAQVDHFVAAFAHSRERSIDAIEAAAAADIDAQYKSRLAVLALRLSAPQLAQSVCQLRSDPSQRTEFVEECSRWHGDLTALAEQVAASEDVPLRSAVALAVASAAHIEAPDKRKWESVLWKWFEEEPDSLTHSTATWALQQWHPTFSDTHVTSEFDAHRDWYVNQIGITMHRMAGGTFLRTDSEDPAADAQTVTITQFLLAAREVTETQFRKFINDSDYPDAEKPKHYQPRATDELYTVKQRPANFISWNDAILFCNWLSETERLDPAYESTGEKRIIPDVEYKVWRLNRQANGYRLPTEAEWEFACRAGTRTSFFHGDDRTLLDRYAVFDAPRWQTTGSKMPNGWGLFDVHGNVWEWCQDSIGPYGRAASVKDPLSDVPGTPRVVRGGAFYDGPQNANSYFRGANVPELGPDGYGFRVARNHP